VRGHPTDLPAPRLAPRRPWSALAAVWLCCAGPSIGQPLPPGHIDEFTGHPRLIVISDIGNEPDDQMSLVRLLLYSNEIDIEALIASTSTWQKTATHPETMRALIHAYGEVRSNLLENAKGWPAADTLSARVFAGQPSYGMAATGAGKMSPGAEAIIRAADRDDPRPLWISMWGGANTLAEALMRVRDTRPPAAVAKFAAKLRVYSISDQDDAGPWIRREFPSLFYIVQPSTPTGGGYYYATWTGISGDIYYRNGCGASMETVTNAWLDRNIRSKGPLGKLYPKYLFIMEGDTPSFLGLIDNGLNSYRRPDWGGWGGRYIYRQPYGETHPIWTQGGDLFSRLTSQDTVRGPDGRECTSDQATISRWRDAFQHDFAARMDWSVADYKHANHNPLAVVNGEAGSAPVWIDARVGQAVTLDASESRDPDGQHLHFSWFLYAEAGSADPSLAAVTVRDADSPKALAMPTATCRPEWLPLNRPCPDQGTAHIILAVTDDGSPQLTSYRRVILRVHRTERAKTGAGRR
jgi:Cellulose-binding Sde182, nucleoside hydrolase-like domain/Cellulose-binding protein Sde0182, C-terminal domain